MLYMPKSISYRYRDVTGQNVEELYQLPLPAGYRKELCRNSPGQRPRACQTSPYPLVYIFYILFLIFRGLPRGPSGGKVLGSIGVVPIDFFVFKMFPFFMSKKILLAGHFAILEPTCRFSEANLAARSLFPCVWVTFLLRIHLVKFISSCRHSYYACW